MLFVVFFHLEEAWPMDVQWWIATLRETNSESTPQNSNGWKMIHVFKEWPVFRGELLVSWRVNHIIH